MAVSDLLYDTLPNVTLRTTGNLSGKLDPDFKDNTRRSHFDEHFNWRIDESCDEFVIRIARKPEASCGDTNVGVKIEGAFSTQPDGSVRFDDGHQVGYGSSSFALLFKISHKSTREVAEDLEEALEEPEEQEIRFFDHPDHKLQLAPENYFNDRYRGQAICDACGEHITRSNARWVYECPNKSACNYCLHAKCGQMARTIRHPGHPQHGLKLLKLNAGSLKKCNVCKAGISHGLFYNCARCDFDVHSECPRAVDKDSSYGDRTRAVTQARTLAVAPVVPGGDQTVQHPSHPQHGLKLCKQEPGSIRRTCDVCRADILHGQFYYCAMCGFDVHSVCPRAVDKDSSSGDRTGAETQSRTPAGAPPVSGGDRTVQHPSHPQHGLKLCNQELGSTSRTCDVCRADISHGQFYNCARCNFDVHCVCPRAMDKDSSSGDRTGAVTQFGTPSGAPPVSGGDRTVRHPSHPQHGLKLCNQELGSTSRTCDVCKADIWHGQFYHCARCNLDVHSVCPRAVAKDSSSGDRTGAVTQFGTPAGAPPVSGGDRTVQHPSHPHHSLKLCKQEPRSIRRTCDVCRADISHGQFYNCARCNFDVHSVCPSPVDMYSSSGDRTWAVTQFGTPPVPPAVPRAERRAALGGVSQARAQATAPLLNMLQIGQQVCDASP